ncbi:TPA: haloacid dehalogenase-like hydrolase, partial [Enterococcus faecium]|nr:haloacid dehalogenase-like hydrolase [Enterococcus faecium]
PYFMESDLRGIVDYIKDFNRNKSIEEKVLVLTANGTSQDSSDQETIKKIALASKACGADIQHIGDSLNGICLPENIFALGQAIRGYRHQIIMLGKSNYR